MASFPLLKTGVVAQYPTDRRRNFPTQVIRFLDGSEQRFAGYGTPLRSWTIHYERLDESELAAVESFFEEQGGRAGMFSFTDPFDGTVYPSCSFANDRLEVEFAGPQDGRMQLVIRENRS